MLNFALIGAAGYIAPRHMRAIKETGGNLSVAFDPFDSVGVLDNFFPQSDFFVEFERFDRHVFKLSRMPAENHINYVSICSPNYLHDAHIRFALRNQAHAICEKPMVLNPWNADALADLEKESGKRIYNILQLRLHPAVIALQKQIAANPTHIHDIDLSYITSRGMWYHIAWKGSRKKSGGVGTNIGIHFFDVLIYLFGQVQSLTIHFADHMTISGYLELERARVRWFLSVDESMLPAEAQAAGQRTYRAMIVDGEAVEFSQGFADLHTESYRKILAGEGFGVQDARPAIDLAYQVRNAKPVGVKGECHPLCREAANV